MGRPTAYATAEARIARICDSVDDALTLRIRIIAEIAQVMDVDAYAWLLTDPETSVGVAPLADVPCLPDLPRLIGLKYLTDIHRWTALRGSPVALLHEATAGELSRSRLWRDMLGGYGVRDVASAIFTDRFGWWGFLDLWRTGARTPFGRAEAAFLTGILPRVTRALRHCQAATFVVRHQVDRLRPGPLVLMLSSDLRVLRQTPETQEYLRLLLPSAEGRTPIPASAYNVAAQLLAIEAGVDRNPAVARVHVCDGLWMTLRAARIGTGPDPTGHDIAVTIEETSATERVGVFSRAFGLSPRESQLLGHLVTGADTRELQARMFLSEHTVHDHFKSIFAKTGSRSRRTLLARALGT